MEDIRDKLANAGIDITDKEKEYVVRHIQRIRNEFSAESKIKAFEMGYKFSMKDGEFDKAMKKLYVIIKLLIDQMNKYI